MCKREIKQKLIPKHFHKFSVFPLSCIFHPHNCIHREFILPYVLFCFAHTTFYSRQERVQATMVHPSQSKSNTTELTLRGESECNFRACIKNPSFLQDLWLYQRTPGYGNWVSQVLWKRKWRLLEVCLLHCWVTVTQNYICSSSMFQQGMKNRLLALDNVYFDWPGY